MKRGLEKKFPNVFNITLEQGRTSSFEIKINGHMVHSKLDTKEWPKPKVLFATIAEGLEKYKKKQAQTDNGEQPAADEEEDGCHIM